MRSVATIACLFLSVTAAMASPPPWANIYVVSGVQRSDRDAPSPEAFQTPAGGILVQVSWKEINPADNVFDWATLDRVVLPAITAGKVPSISVDTGASAPAWLADVGVPYLDLLIARGGVNRACLPARNRFYLPWDSRYVDAYLRLMRRLSLHLTKIAALGRVKMVKVSLFGRLTVEQRLPWDSECGEDIAEMWRAAGYRPSLMLKAWKKVLPSLKVSFPGTALAMDHLAANGFPPIPESGTGIELDAHPELPGHQTALQDDLVRALVATVPGRAVLHWNALTIGGVGDDYATPFVQAGQAVQGYQTNVFMGALGAGCNDLRSEVIAGDAVPCTEDSYDALLHRGLTDGAGDIEVWIPNAIQYPDVIQRAQNAITQE